MKPKAANLGSRPARSTGENPFGQRADGNFESIKDEYGYEIDIQYAKVACRACKEVGKIYNSEHGFKICRACATIQNDGIPEGQKITPKAKDEEMGRFRRALSNKKV